MQRSVANSIIKLLSKSAAKGGGVRPRRAIPLPLWALQLLAILAVIAWTLFLYMQFSVLSAAVEVVVETSREAAADDTAADPCRGRYIYVHDDLPPRFNADILRDCRRNTEGHWGDICASLLNSGLGRPLAGDRVIAGDAGG
ncbi:unnamed protein product [Urochloa humidicola]